MVCGRRMETLYFRQGGIGAIQWTVERVMDSTSCCPIGCQPQTSMSAGLLSRKQPATRVRMRVNAPTGNPSHAGGVPGLPLFFVKKGITLAIQRKSIAPHPSNANGGPTSGWVFPTRQPLTFCKLPFGREHEYQGKAGNRILENRETRVASNP